MKTLKQSTAYNLMVLMIDSADHIAGKAGLTLTITASKNGAAFANITPTVTDRGSGWYNLALTTSHTDTLGDLAIHVTGTGADPVDISLQVFARVSDDLATTAALQVVDDFVDDLETRLSAARAGYLDKLNVPGVLAHSDAAATYKADVSGLATSAALATLNSYVDTEVAAILAAVDTEVAAIKAKTDQLVFTVANKVDANALLGGGGLDAAGVRSAVGLATANLDTQLSTIDNNVDAILMDTSTTLDDLIDTEVSAVLAAVDTEVAAIKAKTDQLIFTVAGQVDANALSGGGGLDAAGIRTAVGLASANLDTQLGTIDSNVDAVLVDTGTTLDGKINVIDDLVDDLETRLTATRAGYLDRLDAAISSRMATFTYTAPPSAADIATAVWGATTRTLSSFGTLIADIWAHATRTLSAFGFTVATNSDANVSAIKAKTDNLPAAPAAVGSAMTLTAAYDRAKDDVLTPLGIVDGIADAIKLKTDLIPAAPAVADEYDAALAAIQADLDNPGQYKADVSGLATSVSLATVDSVVDAIKLKTDNLPADPASEATVNTRLATSGYTAPPSVSAIVTGVWGATTRTLSSFGTLVADIWGYATRTLSAFGFTVSAIPDANVALIKAKTDNLPASPAAVGSAMTLTAGERTAIANEVESQIINEADAERVLTAITDKIASVNPSLDDLTLAGIASAVRTELGTELARIDAAISSRLSSVGYTSPANADVAAIKAKTDNLPNDPADQSILAALIGALPAAPSEMDIVNALKSSVFDGVLTFEDSIKLYNAILFGKLDGGGSGTLKFRNPSDTKDRVTAAVDLSNGDRDNITLDLT